MKKIKLEIINQISDLLVKIRILIDKVGATEEKCLFEYTKRMKDEGCLKEAVFISAKNEVVFLKEKNITIYSSEKAYKKRIKSDGGMKNFRHLGAGIIEFKYYKNTRGNNANIEALLGAAIICTNAANEKLQIKDYCAIINFLLKATEAYGAAHGRFHSQISTREQKAIQKQEIKDKIKSLFKKNPALSRQEATKIALRQLNYPANKLSRARRF